MPGKAKHDPKPEGLTVGPQGRVVIPAPLREALGLEPGTRLIARVEEGRLVLETVDVALRRLQAEFKAKVPRGVSLVDELLRDRREEARRERA